MDDFTDELGHAPGRIGQHVRMLAGVLSDAGATSTVSQEPSGEAPGLESATLRMLAARAFLTGEWGSSVDSRLSEACTVLGLPARYARALREGGLGEWFSSAWAAWGESRASSLAPQLFDPRILAPDAPVGGVPVIPFDVLEAVSGWLATHECDTTPRVLDLTAGTGSMATALLTKLLASGRYSGDDLLAGLRLVEADRERLDVACVIVARALERSSAHSPAEVLRRVRACAVAGSALEWSAATDEQFDLVVGTTPLGPGDDGGARPGSQENDPSPRYLQVLCERVAEGGFGTLTALSAVVTAPLGLFAVARDRLLERFKTTEFLTFDHAPVALLGSADGASRTIVRVGRSGIGQVTTTPVMRCSPEGRRVALSDAPRTMLHQTPPFGRHTFVPRIGSDVERRLVDAVIVQGTGRWKGFRVQLTHGEHRADDDVLSVGATARDSFSIALREPRIHFGEPPTASARFGVRPSEPELGDAALAVLVTRTAFWWWRASGDGLHVRREHVTEPLSWLRLLTPEELELGVRVAVAWRAGALAKAGGTYGQGYTVADEAERSRLTWAFDQVLLSHLGATEDGAREFLSRKSLVDI